MRQSLPVLFAAAALTLLVAPARAEPYRRPGLDGRWTNRHLTAPMNSLRMLAGPGQPMLLGARFGEQIVDAGGQYSHSGAPGTEDEWWLRGGVGFGLTEDWEAGALFLPFQFAPDFNFSNITVFVTRGFRFESWDLGLRLLFQTPNTNDDDARTWDLNPSIPFLYRVGAVRLDAALVVPFRTRDWWVGLNLPVRASANVGPHVFFGLESGFVEPRFDVSSDTTVPLGVMAGYTALFGNRVVDFTATFSWDSFVLPVAEDGADTFNTGSYRAGLGIVMHSLVK